MLKFGVIILFKPHISFPISLSPNFIPPKSLLWKKKTGWFSAIQNISQKFSNKYFVCIKHNAASKFF